MLLEILLYFIGIIIKIIFYTFYIIEIYQQ